MKKKEDKKERVPIPCVCGSEAIIVVFRGKKMVSCPNPEKCIGNLRTQWHGQKENAIVEWDAAVNSFKHSRR